MSRITGDTSYPLSEGPGRSKSSSSKETAIAKTALQGALPEGHEGGMEAYLAATGLPTREKLEPLWNQLTALVQSACERAEEAGPAGTMTATTLQNTLQGLQTLWDQAVKPFITLKRAEYRLRLIKAAIFAVTALSNILNHVLRQPEAWVASLSETQKYLQDQAEYFKDVQKKALALLNNPLKNPAATTAACLEQTLTAVAHTDPRLTATVATGAIALLGDDKGAVAAAIEATEEFFPLPV